MWSNITVMQSQYISVVFYNSIISNILVQSQNITLNTIEYIVRTHWKKFSNIIVLNCSSKYSKPVVIYNHSNIDSNT